MKHTELHNSPFDHDAYERDGTWIPLALTVLGIILAATVIYAANVIIHDVLKLL